MYKRVSIEQMFTQYKTCISPYSVVSYVVIKPSYVIHNMISLGRWHITEGKYLITPLQVFNITMYLCLCNGHLFLFVCGGFQPSEGCTHHITHSVNYLQFYIQSDCAG